MTNSVLPFFGFRIRQLVSFNQADTIKCISINTIFFSLYIFHVTEQFLLNILKEIIFFHFKSDFQNQHRITGILG